MVNLNPIRDRLNGPFVPFVIHLTDGRKFEVPHRDFVAVGKGIVVVVDKNDSTHTVDSLHIVSITDASAKKTRSRQSNRAAASCRQHVEVTLPIFPKRRRAGAA